MTVFWEGEAVVVPNVSYDGQERFTLYVGDDANAILTEPFTPDVCQITQAAQDWANSPLGSGADPYPNTSSTCSGCQWTFTVALTSDRETSITGDCAALGVAADDIAFSYAWHPTDGFMYYIAGTGTWYDVPGTSGFQGGMLEYRWPGNVYTY